MAGRKPGPIRTVTALAEALAWPRSSLRERLRIAGCPISRKPPWTRSDVAKLRAWSAGRSSAREATEPSGPVSPAIDRFREARARLVELEAKEREGSVVPLEEVRATCRRVAEEFRRVNEVLRREFPPGHELMEAALDTLEREFGLRGGPIVVAR